MSVIKLKMSASRQEGNEVTRNMTEACCAGVVAYSGKGTRIRPNNVKQCHLPYYFDSISEAVM